MNLDKETQAYITTVAQKAAEVAVDNIQRKNLSKLEAVAAIEVKRQETCILAEMDNLNKAISEVEGEFKQLTEKINWVARPPSDDKTLSHAVGTTDKDAPLVRYLSEQTTRLYYLASFVREVRNRLQIEGAK